MIKDGIGGANTKTGLRFEKRVDIKKLLQNIKGYDLRKTTNKSGYRVFYKNEEVARCFQKHEFYRFLEEYQIEWKKIFLNNYYLTMDCLLS